MPTDLLSYKQVEGMSYPEIQAANDKASRDKVAALFGMRTKEAVPSRKITTTGGPKKKIVSGDTGGTQKQVIAPTTQIGNADRLLGLQKIQEKLQQPPKDGRSINKDMTTDKFKGLYNKPNKTKKDWENLTALTKRLYKPNNYTTINKIPLNRPKVNSTSALETLINTGGHYQGNVVNDKIVVNPTKALSSLRAKYPDGDPTTPPSVIAAKQYYSSQLGGIQGATEAATLLGTSALNGSVSGIKWLKDVLVGKGGYNSLLNTLSRKTGKMEAKAKNNMSHTGFSTNAVDAASTAANIVGLPAVPIGILKPIKTASTVLDGTVDTAKLLKRTGGDILSTIRHPLETVSNMSEKVGNMAVKGISKVREDAILTRKAKQAERVARQVKIAERRSKDAAGEIEQLRQVQRKIYIKRGSKPLTKGNEAELNRLDEQIGYLRQFIK